MRMSLLNAPETEVNRLADFRKLIRNESVKLRHGKFIWIMLILMLIASVGLSALLGIGMRMLNSIDDEASYPLSEECDTELQYWSDYAAYAEEEYVQEQVLFYTTLRSLGMTRSDWRYQTGAVRDYAGRKAQGLPGADELEQIIFANDHKGWYRMNIAEIEEIYAGNSPIQELYTTAERYCLENDVLPCDSDWRYAVACHMETYLISQRNLEAHRDAGIRISEESLEAAKNGYAIAAYQLENNIPVNPMDSAGLLDSLVAIAMGGGEETVASSQLWTSLFTGVSLISIVSLVGVVIAAGIVANEFQKGTIKFLLITPARRWKILLAKYCTVLNVVFAMTILLFAANLLFSIIFCGGQHLLLPEINATNGVIHTSSPFLRLIGRYLLELVGPIVSLTLAFAISSLFRHSSAATAISLCLLYIGNFVNQLLAMFGADWGRYLIFANMDFASIQRGVNLYYRDQSLTVAIIVIVLHMIVFLLTAFDAFDRREV